MADHQVNRFGAFRIRWRVMTGSRMGLSAILVLASIGASQAALAPPLQRQRELIAVLGHPDVIAKLGIVEKIEAVAPDRFRVFSDHCSLDVIVERVGPRESVAGGGELRVSPSTFRCR